MQRIGQHTPIQPSPTQRAERVIAGEQLVSAISSQSYGDLFARFPAQHRRGQDGTVPHRFVETGRQGGQFRAGGLHGYDARGVVRSVPRRHTVEVGALIETGFFEAD